jgi:hypothetical protein
MIYALLASTNAPLMGGFTRQDLIMAFVGPEPFASESMVTNWAVSVKMTRRKIVDKMPHKSSYSDMSII